MTWLLPLLGMKSNGRDLVLNFLTVLRIRYTTAEFDFFEGQLIYATSSET
jgi:hypothetical protein